MSVFTVTLTPRRYETDFNGHVNALMYFDWADYARGVFLGRAGVSVETMVRHKLGPVLLEAERSLGSVGVATA
ncbi:acyl-CoA thioesterase [Saccharopolyspora sp. K220]|uniref:acyl-CoA thioesterase n=1 Tax=Saccharopolyspora soli TaxID=2926618 RepID=UPI0035561882|nr:acyl-CoA thioesterase [Saccharopolyspora soli]